MYVGISEIPQPKIIIIIIIKVIIIIIILSVWIREWVLCTRKSLDTGE